MCGLVIESSRKEEDNESGRWREGWNGVERGGERMVKKGTRGRDGGYRERRLKESGLRKRK